MVKFMVFTVCFYFGLFFGLFVGKAEDDSWLKSIPEPAKIQEVAPLKSPKKDTKLENSVKVLKRDENSSKTEKEYEEKKTEERESADQSQENLEKQIESLAERFSSSCDDLSYDRDGGEKSLTLYASPEESLRLRDVIDRVYESQNKRLESLFSDTIGWSFLFEIKSVIPAQKPIIDGTEMLVTGHCKLILIRLKEGNNEN